MESLDAVQEKEREKAREREGKTESLDSERRDSNNTGIATPVARSPMETGVRRTANVELAPISKNRTGRIAQKL